MHDVPQDTRSSTGNRRCCRAVFLVVLISGCSPTPEERITQLHGRITSRADRVIDLDLSGTGVTDSDMTYIHGLCSNSGRKWKAIHTLDLSGTAITDRALDMMTMQNRFTQNGFSSQSGIRVLILRDTDTSDAAVQKYQMSAPECEIRK